MSVVELTQLPTYHAPVIEGSMADVLVPSDVFRSLQVTGLDIKGSPTDTVAAEATLSLTTVGSQIPPREFECVLRIDEGLITAEAQSGNIAFRIMIQFDFTMSGPQLQTWEINFHLLPNPLAETALWFHEFSYAVGFEGRPIHIELQSDRLAFKVQSECSSAIEASSDLAAQMEEAILLYRQLLSIGNTFHISFRIPEMLSAQDILTTDVVYKAISEGIIASIDVYRYWVSAPGPSEFYEQKADVRITFKDVTASILGQTIHLGPAVFFAPSATVRCLGSVEESGQVAVEIDFKQFGGYSWFLNYIPPLLFERLGISKENLASGMQDALSLSPPKFLESIKQNIFEETLLEKARWEGEQREKRLSVLLGRQRERFDAILTWFAQLDEDIYEEPVGLTWREPELIE